MGERALDGEMAVLGRNGGFGPDAPVVPARSLHAAGSVRRFESLRGRCRRPRLRNHLLPRLGRLAGFALTAPRVSPASNGECPIFNAEEARSLNSGSSSYPRGSNLSALTKNPNG